MNPVIRMKRIVENYPNENEHFTTLYNEWVEFTKYNYPQPEFYVDMNTKYFQASLVFPPKKYWYHWTTILHFNLGLIHKFDEKEYGIEASITILDLALSIEISNDKERFPSYWVKEEKNTEQEE